MSSRFALVTIALSAAVAFLTGFDVAGTLQPLPAVTSVSADSVRVPPGRPAERAAGVASFADIAERINPAVVNVDTTSRGRRRLPAGHPPLTPFHDPFDENDTPHGDGRELPRRGAGSG